MNARGRRSNRLRTLGGRLVTTVLLIAAVPVTGLLVTYPLWYLSTTFRGLYTLLFLLGTAISVVCSLRRSKRDASA